MRYFKLLLFSSLFLASSLYALEAQELLAQWKEMAEQERTTLIAQSNNDGYANLWNCRTKLDHIKIRYDDVQGNLQTTYIQLEHSILRYGSGLTAAFIFPPRYFSYEKNKVDELLKQLMSILPLEKKPKVSVRLSRKNRVEKKWLFNKEINDLYSVTIDYSEPKPSAIDWYKR